MLFDVQEKQKLFVKALIILNFALFAVGCRDKSVHTAPKTEDASEVGKQKVSNKKVLKVQLAERIEPFMGTSVAEKWNRETWIGKFGNPLRDRDLGSGLEYLEYIEPGPYKPSGRRLITGVVVTLKDGVTLNCEWHYTEFGRPGDWPK